MAKENETIADVIAEMRSDANADQYTPDGILGQKLNYIADRLEAAHKRERGDCAKLREALESAERFVNEVGKAAMNNKVDAVTICQCAASLASRIAKALAAPPRNCDKYDAESCRMAYHLHGDGLMTMQAFADWLFAPAAESEAGK